MYVTVCKYDTYVWHINWASLVSGSLISSSHKNQVDHQVGGAGAAAGAELLNNELATKHEELTNLLLDSTYNEMLITTVWMQYLQNTTIEECYQCISWYL